MPRTDPTSAWQRRKPRWALPWHLVVCICTAHSLCTVQDMFKRLVDAVPEVKFELYSFKTTIKCKEMLEQDCWFENKVKQELDLHPASAQQLRVAVSGSNIVCTAGEFQLFAAGEAPWYWLGVCRSPQTGGEAQCTERFYTVLPY